jgi:hypothetical protein
LRLRLDALHRGPSFDQLAIDGEVITLQKEIIPLGLRQHRREELGRDVAFSSRSGFFENTE